MRNNDNEFLISVDNCNLIGDKDLLDTIKARIKAYGGNTLLMRDIVCDEAPEWFEWDMHKYVRRRVYCMLWKRVKQPHSRYWTPEQKEILLEMQSTYPLAEIADKLNRSYESIRKKRKRENARGAE